MPVSEEEFVWLCEDTGFTGLPIEAGHIFGDGESLIIGGMPECVASWIRYKDPTKVSQIQWELIEVYENDFSKHNGKVNSGRILLVFRSIVTQLAKANEKFMYGAVREGGRARDFDEAIEWLVSAGMLNRVYNGIENGTSASGI